jgi:hypothetical protein
MAAIFEGITGANFENQKQVIVDRIKAAAKGRFKDAIKLEGKTMRSTSTAI